MTKKTTREACRRANEEGDQTLCEQENCPWYGDPDGCNHPTRNRDEAPYGNAAAMRVILEKCRDYFVDLLEEVNVEEEKDLLAKIDAALAEPARNCDRFRNETEAEDAYTKEHPGEDKPDANTYGAWLLHTEKKHD